MFHRFHSYTDSFPNPEMWYASSQTLFEIAIHLALAQKQNVFINVRPDQIVLSNLSGTLIFPLGTRGPVGSFSQVAEEPLVCPLEDRCSIYSTHTLMLLSFLRWSLIECDLFKMLCITLKTKSLIVHSAFVFSGILRGLPCSRVRISFCWKLSWPLQLKGKRICLLDLNIKR